MFSLTVLRIALNARSADGRTADSSSSHAGVASDQRAMMATISTAASCGTLPDALLRELAVTTPMPTPTRIHISTTTIVQHDPDFLAKPPGLEEEFVLPIPVVC